MRAPGRSHRKGITVLELIEMFPDEATAAKWFAEVRWPDGRFCPCCGSERTYATKTAKPMPFRCTDCCTYFSVKTGTALERSKLPLQKWAVAIYLYLTNLKGISSMKLHRELGVTQRTAWFVLHRLREAWDMGAEPFEGPIEVDEAYFGGLEKNKHMWKRVQTPTPPPKTIVAGAKDRATGAVHARVVPNTGRATLHAFVAEVTPEGATVYTDQSRAYKNIPHAHKAVNHSVGEYVNGMAHTNGIESFWAMLKRGYHGTYHKMSP